MTYLLLRYLTSISSTFGKNNSKFSHLMEVLPHFNILFLIVKLNQTSDKKRFDDGGIRTLARED